MTSPAKTRMGWVRHDKGRGRRRDGVPGEDRGTRYKGQVPQVRTCQRLTMTDRVERPRPGRVAQASSAT